MTTRVFIFIFVYTVTVPSKYRRDIIVECVCKHVYVKLVRVYYCSKGTDVSQSAFRRRSSDRRRGKNLSCGKGTSCVCVCMCVCVAKKGAIGGKCVDYELVESASCREFTGESVARL